jgi:molecular chaperone Hsp33
MALLDEQNGEIEIDCQFCNTRYLFDRSRLEGLFHSAQEHAKRLH